jgi:hypothetical protein
MYRYKKAMIDHHMRPKTWKKYIQKERVENSKIRTQFSEDNCLAYAVYKYTENSTGNDKRRPAVRKSRANQKRR